MVPSTSSSSAIGSAKRRSVTKDGTGRRGAIGSSSRPERLVETAHERFAEARGERRARAVDHIGDALEPDLRQRGDRLRCDPQRGERQRQQRFARLFRRDTQFRAIARHRPCAAHGVGDRGARLETLGVKPRHEVAAQRLLAAEQMRAAGDVEQQPVRRIEADQRRVAVAPVGDRDRAGARSASGSASATAMRGYIARASASAMPALSPSRAAASLTAASRSAPFTGSVTTSGLASAGAGERGCGSVDPSSAAAATPRDSVCGRKTHAW